MSGRWFYVLQRKDGEEFPEEQIDRIGEERKRFRADAMLPLPRNRYMLLVENQIDEPGRNYLQDTLGLELPESGRVEDMPPAYKRQTTIRAISSRRTRRKRRR